MGVNASATARGISRRRNDDDDDGDDDGGDGDDGDDDDEISFLVEETGVPGGNHRPTAPGVQWPNVKAYRPIYVGLLYTSWAKGGGGPDPRTPRIRT